MRWLRFFLRSGVPADPLVDWRRSWAEAVENPDPARVEALRMQLTQAGAADDDAWEVEREMLDGLAALTALARDAAAGILPEVPTGHRAVGLDTCHLVVRGGMPDDPEGPSGTLLLTSSRLLFVGGRRTLTIPWRALAACVRQDRDLLLARADRPDASRIRCNTYGDALQAAFVARLLSRRARDARL